MDDNVQHALQAFTQRYMAAWQQVYDHLPASGALYGVASPCVVENDGERVFWTPQPVAEGATLDGVSRALTIALHSDAEPFFTTQYAGDMEARFADIDCLLLQSWSEDDFMRMQENLIGHLLTHKRLKLSPTLFLATTESEMALFSLSNVSGEVWLETFGTREHRVLAPSLSVFLQQLQPRVR